MRLACEELPASARARRGGRSGPAASLRVFRDRHLSPDRQTIAPATVAAPHRTWIIASLSSISNLSATNLATRHRQHGDQRPPSNTSSLRPIRETRAPSETRPRGPPHIYTRRRHIQETARYPPHPHHSLLSGHPQLPRARPPSTSRLRISVYQRRVVRQPATQRRGILKSKQSGQQ